MLKYLRILLLTYFMELLKHLESEWIWIIRKAAGYFLADNVSIKKEEVVQNLVWLISGLKSWMMKVPKNYPRPLSGIIKNWFDMILKAGGSLKIRLSSEKDYRILEWQEKDDFIAKCDTLRFTVVEDGRDSGTLLVDIIQ